MVAAPYRVYPSAAVAPNFVSSEDRGLLVLQRDSCTLNRQSSDMEIKIWQ